MADLYGTGCERCNKEIASALKEMPLMDGYLNTDDYHARYHSRKAETRPLPYIDGEYKTHVIATVVGEDGWLLRMAASIDNPHRYPTPVFCPNDPDNLCYELWRGNVEIR